jgi:DNA-binding GntR family transcriptional regulator
MGANAHGGISPDRSTLADRIYDRLEAEILAGQLAPGSRLLIVPLAKRFGTSQAPVREAIQRLTEEGLAVTEPYAGTVLKVPSWSEVEEIYQLREELEAFAVRRIMSQAKVSFRSDHPIKRALRELQRAVRTGAAMDIVDADMAFHRAVCTEAKSTLALELWSMITKRLRGARLTFESRQPDDQLSTVVERHQMLVEALESGDAPLAEQAFREHLSAALLHLKEVEKDSEAAFDGQQGATV